MRYKSLEIVKRIYDQLPAYAVMHGKWGGSDKFFGKPDDWEEQMIYMNDCNGSGATVVLKRWSSPMQDYYRCSFEITDAQMMDLMREVATQVDEFWGEI